jgi:hypothetical protein
MSRKTQLLSLVLAAVAVMAANQHVIKADGDDKIEPMFTKDNMPPVSKLQNAYQSKLENAYHEPERMLLKESDNFIN